jgi:hypothetical protein
MQKPNSDISTSHCLFTPDSRLAYPSGADRDPFPINDIPQALNGVMILKRHRTPVADRPFVSVRQKKTACG